ncbi:hypothetical protein [Thiomicrorhabdus aquaedulcis]|uniref:hypothetical protein n=1 Tax=Thiomicrorhabdus aquaedulcis TaxID=2211106 RepID=UPI000FD76F78|nr:hypothetical protein [Thiomicrorhabdus aquaedulcis]
MSYYLFKLSFYGLLSMALVSLSACSTFDSAEWLGLDAQGTSLKVPDYYSTKNLPTEYSPGQVYYIQSVQE